MSDYNEVMVDESDMDRLLAHRASYNRLVQRTAQMHGEDEEDNHNSFH